MASDRLSFSSVEIDKIRWKSVTGGHVASRYQGRPPKDKEGREKWPWERGRSATEVTQHLFYKKSRLQKLKVRFSSIVQIVLCGFDCRLNSIHGSMDPCQAYRATSPLVWEPPPQSNGDFSFKRLISIRFLPQSQPSLLGGSTVFGLRHHGKFLIKSTTASACTYYWNLPIKYKLKYLSHLCELFPR